MAAKENDEEEEKEKEKQGIKEESLDGLYLRLLHTHLL